MPCYHPMKMYRAKKANASGKFSLLPSSKGSNGGIQTLPCGQCIGCKLEYSRKWAARISAEASCYEKNCFITLTYSDEYLPSDGSLVLEHFQSFMKKLRFKYGSNIRFFHCGEYGERLGRPHYHACLLNFDFSDREYLATSSRGDVTFTSKSLAELWPYGHHQIGTLTFESAAYCARYVTKKITGKNAHDHYTRIDQSTGEVIKLRPEYTTMSRRPGVGVPFVKKFGSDIYSYDQFVIRGGVGMRPPKIFDRHYELINPSRFAKIEKQRLIKNSTDMCKKIVDSTESRLKVREVVHEATLRSTLKRKYEE